MTGKLGFVLRYPPCHTLDGPDFHDIPFLQEIPFCHDSEQPARAAGHTGEHGMRYAKHHVLIFKSQPTRFLLNCAVLSTEASLRYHMTSLPCAPEWGIQRAILLFLLSTDTKSSVSTKGCSLSQHTPHRKTMPWHRASPGIRAQRALTLPKVYFSPLLKELAVQIWNPKLLYYITCLQ